MEKAKGGEDKVKESIDDEAGGSVDTEANTPQGDHRKMDEAAEPADLTSTEENMKMMKKRSHQKTRLADATYV